MANFAIKDQPGALQMTDVGKRYHVGLGVPSPSQPTKLNMYGYNLTRKDSGGADWSEKSDAKTRDTLSSVGSPNVTDRDLSPIPHVTDGNFSGGGLQQIFIDATKYYDSDMEIRQAGLLTLRVAWANLDLAGALATPQQCVPYSALLGGAPDVWVTYAEASKAIYAGSGTLTAPYQTFFLDTDGALLWGADQSGNLWKWSWASGFTSYPASVPAGAVQMWAVDLGTNGTFLYFSVLNGAGTGFHHDLFRVPITDAAAPGAIVQVPLGYNPTMIADIVPYGTGVAILMNDSLGGAVGSMSVWFHDGQSLSLMMRLRGYQGVGMCDALGELYVTTVSNGGFASLEQPVLMRVSQGSFEIVARIGSQLSAGGSLSSMSAPVASGQYVAFHVYNPTIAGIVQTPVPWIYDVLSGAVSHTGTLPLAVASPPAGVRGMAWLGRSLIVPTSRAGTTKTVVFQTSQAAWTVGGLLGGPTPTGQMVTSLIDFNTPGLPKQFRRVIVSHQRIAFSAGITVTASLFVDKDPQSYVSGVTTPDATASNSVIGTTKTVLNVPGHLVGAAAYIVVQVTTAQSSAPAVFWVSVEVSPPYVYDFDLDCTRDQQTLDGREDPQQLEGKDRIGMLRNSYENGQPLTLWTDFGESKLVNITDYELRRTSVANQSDGQHRADVEGYVRVTLSEVVA